MSKGKIVCKEKDYAVLSDGTAFRFVNLDDDLSFRLVYAQDTITRGDMLRLASLMDSYHYLMFECSEARRNSVCREIKELRKADEHS